MAKTGVKLTSKQLQDFERVLARRSQPGQEKERLILSGQVADDLMPYAKAALSRGVSKTDLINLALAAYFEVQVSEGALMPA